MNKIFYFVIAVLIIGILIGAFYYTEKDGYTDEPGKYDLFAQCLTDKGFVMYGAEWCSHCKNEKKAFGNSFRLIKYVECPEETDLCIAEGIEGYPTWKAGGAKYEGEQGLARLAEISGCVLPE